MINSLTSFLSGDVLLSWHVGAHHWSKITHISPIYPTDQPPCEIISKQSQLHMSQSHGVTFGFDLCEIRMVNYGNDDGQDFC
jgi:hypothetical protein